MIRFIQENEIDALLVLCVKDMPITKKPSYDSKGKKEALTQALFAEKPDLYCLVAVLDEKIVGYATFMKQYSTWDVRYYIYMDCLFLTEETRGQGIGKAMMERIKIEALALACNLIQWQTPDFNVDGMRFYNRLGAISKSKERYFWHIQASGLF